MSTSNSVPMAVFGPGSLYVTRTDIANQTPVNIGYAQEFSYDEAAESKELYGQKQYPLVVARGTIKATGKMKAATVSGIALNAVFNGDTFATGQLQMAQGVAVTAAATVTVTPTTGSFDTDLGLLYADTGYVLQKVTGAPSVGQYAFTITASAGIYTLNTGETDTGMLVTYAFTTTGTGQTLTVLNQNIGATPTFQIDYASSLFGSPYYARFFACVSNKLTRQHKLTDFMMPECDFGFFALPNGKVYELSYPAVF